MKLGELSLRGTAPLAFLAVAFVLACPASARPASDAAIKATVLQHETAALEAFRTHDKKAFAALCLPSFYEVTSTGTINTLEDQLHELDDYTLGDYKMENVVVTLVPPDMALVRYKILASYSFKGKALPAEQVLATAVWVKRKGSWKAATYQEVALKP